MASKIGQHFRPSLSAVLLRPGRVVERQKLRVSVGRARRKKGRHFKRSLTRRDMIVLTGDWRAEERGRTFEPCTPAIFSFRFSFFYVFFSAFSKHGFSLP